MQRLKGYLIGLALLVGAALVAALLVLFAPESERLELPPHIPFVETGEVSVGSETIPIFGAGTARPVAEISIVPQVNGKVEWISENFVSGGQVTEGEILIGIEDEDYVFQLRDAEADLAAQQVNLLRAEESAVAARREYERFSKNQLGTDDDALRANPLTLHEPQLRAAQAALARAEARVESAQTALSRTEIRAPFDGYVREEMVTLGQYLSPGTKVGSVFASEVLEVVVPLSDSNISSIPGIWERTSGRTRAGASVFASFGDRRYRWSAFVHRANASLDQETRTIELVIHIPDPFVAGTPIESTDSTSAPPLLVGKFVEVEILGSAPVEHFKIPRLALQYDNEVWVVQDDQTITIVHVDILQRGHDEVYVAGDLADGQRVVISGIEVAVDNMMVRSKPQ